MDGFKSLAAEFREAATVNFATDNDAAAHVRAIAGRAVSATAAAYREGRIQDKSGAFDVLTQFADAAERQFNPRKRIRQRRMCWESLLMTAAMQSSKLPDTLVVGGQENDLHNLQGDPGAFAVVTTFAASRWRQFAADSAILCELLAEAAGDAAPVTEPYPDPTNDHELQSASKLAKDYIPAAKREAFKKELERWRTSTGKYARGGGGKWLEGMAWEHSESPRRNEASYRYKPSHSEITRLIRQWQAPSDSPTAVPRN